MGHGLRIFPRIPNITEWSREEFQDNLILRYGIVPLNPPTDCDGCVKNFSVPHALSLPKGGIFLEWHNCAAKEWGDLLAWAFNILCISYELNINSRTIQG